MKEDAPDLYPKLIRQAPKPVAYGYQILPKILPDDPKLLEKAAKAIGPVEAEYSWPKTLGYIGFEISKVEELDEKLGAATKLNDPQDRRALYGKMVEEFPVLEDDQRTIDEHVQYNAFWQKAIADDKPRFDRLTKLCEIAEQLQTVREALAARDDKQFRDAVSHVSGLDLSESRFDLTLKLRDLLDQYSKVIAAEADKIVQVPFLKITNSKPNHWLIEVPLYSDIDSPQFLKRFKQSIEDAWRLDTASGETFTVKLKLLPIKASKLYAGKRPPKKGEHIDVEKHVARFPNSAPVLTTGSNMTYAMPGRSIALGPQPIVWRVLAHEFGHVLGFIDNYFRGYRDLGQNNGFEIIEVVSDPQNLMASPETGHVLRHHFEKLIKTNAKPELAKKLKSAL